MARGNKRGAIHVDKFQYKKHGHIVKVPGYTRSRPGGKRGSQKKA